MSGRVEPLDACSWVKGDYRYGASISATATSIESLAQSIGATLQEFVEDGLGPGRVFGLRLPTGRQVAFEQYERGAGGVSLIVLFENGACSSAEIWQTLELLNVPAAQVTWVASEAK